MITRIMLTIKGKVIMPGLFQGEEINFGVGILSLLFFFFKGLLVYFGVFYLFLSVRNKPGKDGNTGNRLESIVSMYREI